LLTTDFGAGGLEDSLNRAFLDKNTPFSIKSLSYGVNPVVRSEKKLFS
jgi:hypothetical protein